MDTDAKIIPLRPPASGTALAGRDDDDLMALAAGGLADAFAHLTRRYQARVRGYCRKWTGDAAAGDDVAQEVFGELWRTRLRYQPAGRFVVYLFTIVHNRCRNAYRARRAMVPLPDELAAGSPDQLDALLDAERRRRVHREIAALSPKLKEAILMRFTEGLDYAQAAEVLGCPEATVRSRVFLGLERLRLQLTGETP